MTPPPVTASLSGWILSTTNVPWTHTRERQPIPALVHREMPAPETPFTVVAKAVGGEIARPLTIGIAREELFVRATAYARALTALLPVDPHADALGAAVLARQPTSGVKRAIPRGKR